MNGQRHGLGWHRDLPDFRDYTPETKSIDKLFKGSKLTQTKKTRLKASADLTAWCPPIEDQGSIGSCTAQSGVGLIEYYERRAFDHHIDASRLFLYKATRNLLHWTGDTGAYLRTTMKAMVLFGVPPEEYFPYVAANVDVEPDAFCYSFAENYKTIRYYRLDPPGTTTNEILDRVRRMLNYGFPAMFGFTVYNYGNDVGEVWYPTKEDRVRGGHAVVAVGYDDKRKIGNVEGALKIRNSWGTGWGEAGYGWLPYAYVEEGLATDFWSLFKSDYIATGNFG